MSGSESLFSLPFDELQVGSAHTTRGRTVTEADVVGFAALTGDFHPQHVDAQWAGAGPFGERIAHGMLVLSYAVGLVPLDPERIMALRRVKDAVFKRPVRFGDTIRVKTKIASAEPVDDGAGLVTCAWSVVNQDDKLVMRAAIEVLWRREPAGTPTGQAPAGAGTAAGETAGSTGAQTMDIAPGTEELAVGGADVTPDGVEPPRPTYTET